MMKGSHPKILERTLQTVGYSGLALWMVFFFLWSQYDATRPTIPDPNSGRVISLETHGHVVYLTSNEQRNLNYLPVAAFLLLGTAAILAAYMQHPERFSELREDLRIELYSLWTLAGWCAVARAIREETASVVQTFAGFAHPERVELHSKNSIEGCRDQLKRVYANGMNISGDANRDRIHLFVVQKDLRNSFAPHFYGKLKTEPTGTLVSGRFRLPVFIQGFLLLWFGGIAVLMVTLALLTARGAVLNSTIALFFPPLLFLFGVLLVHFGNKLSSSDKAQILKFLRQTLNA